MKRKTVTRDRHNDNLIKLLPSGQTIQLIIEYNKRAKLPKRLWAKGVKRGIRTKIWIRLNNDEMISGSSLCGPQDNFSYYTGKKNALRRLFDKDIGHHFLSDDDRTAIVQFCMPKYFNYGCGKCAKCIAKQSHLCKTNNGTALPEETIATLTRKKKKAARNAYKKTHRLWVDVSLPKKTKLASDNGKSQPATPWKEMSNHVTLGNEFGLSKDIH